MSAQVIQLRRKRKGWSGTVNNRHFVAKKYADNAPRKFLDSISFLPSGKKKKAECHKCHRPVRRSWKTEILWDTCSTCRHLMTIYGPNIEVEWVGKE